MPSTGHVRDVTYGTSEERLAAARASYEEVMTFPGPDPTKPYYDAGVVGFVFGEMWPRPGLSRRDRRWITLACVGAAGAPIPIQTHLAASLRSGDCTLEEVREFNLVFATQLGWPKGQVVDQYLGEAWARIVSERGEQPGADDFVRWLEPAPPAERRARGRREYEAIMGAPAPEPRTLFRGLGYVDYLYGEIWSRPTLSRRERRIIAICCAASIDHDVPAHLRAALETGDLGFEELQELVLHVAVYLGWLIAARLDDHLVEAWDAVQGARAAT